MKRWVRFLNFLILLSGVSIATYLAVFYSFVIRAWIELGRLPSYNNPDPRTLGFTSNTSLLERSFELAFFSSILSIIFLAVLKLRKKYINHRHLHFFLFMLLFLFYNIMADPFMEWFAD
jgi:hypothetical protein